MTKNVSLELRKEDYMGYKAKKYNVYLVRSSGIYIT
ncbi:hypothetical protein VAMP_106108n11 [Candidatus Vampirococcus lugosii]|uniref:Uncharacterized protein n=1 Tax=Candidatus Vampirococcus lugosii TaxID=2789015 RepID=A0ABS5QN51_9BACT|nr:hypothetical protein [Candidatus Vampirococcus lugosii]